jgi:hypothetical protein
MPKTEIFRQMNAIEFSGNQGMLSDPSAQNNSFEQWDRKDDRLAQTSTRPPHSLLGHLAR